MKEFFTRFLSWLKSIPLRFRVLALLCLSVLLLVITVSCGPVVRVSARTANDSVVVSVSQNVVDSTGVSVSVNPNLYF